MEKSEFSPDQQLTPEVYKFFAQGLVRFLLETEVAGLNQQEKLGLIQSILQEIQLPLDIEGLSLLENDGLEKTGISDEDSEDLPLLEILRSGGQSPILPSGLYEDVLEIVAPGKSYELHTTARKAANELAAEYPLNYYATDKYREVVGYNKGNIDTYKNAIFWKLMKETGLKQDVLSWMEQYFEKALPVAAGITGIETMPFQMNGFVLTRTVDQELPFTLLQRSYIQTDQHAKSLKEELGIFDTDNEFRIRLGAGMYELGRIRGPLFAGIYITFENKAARAAFEQLYDDTDNRHWTINAIFAILLSTKISSDANPDYEYRSSRGQLFYVAPNKFI